jgi:CxxC motif-containing protein (DUF1111 family)
VCPLEEHPLCDRRRGLLSAGLLGIVVACSPPESAVEQEPGAPLPGLSQEELARFRRGESLFNRVFTPGEGLGPLFNENQCSACHTSPASGGTGEQLVVKATHFEALGRCDLLEREGGLNVRRQATPAMRALGVERETTPRRATAHGRFTVPFLFGLGLVEAIPAEVIVARADSADANRDGISGRVARTADGRVGRFGRKGEAATLLEFAAGALRLEMGLTSPAYPSEAPVAGSPVPPHADPAPDPEISAETLEQLVEYLRLLAPLGRRALASAAARDSVARGERLFGRLGCASCHVPELRTGPNVSPLDRKLLRLYSDLLLHNMGPALADVCGLTAAPSEVRTELLMGLRYREAFLHDGRAGSIRDAILLHAGEAASSRDAFARLDRLTQEYLLRFLDSL